MLGRAMVLGDITSSAPKLRGLHVPASHHARILPPAPYGPLFSALSLALTDGWLRYDTALLHSVTVLL